jgi:mannose-1-phosphate guanylyltransferase/mannose-6-phosphate isomerase
MQQKTIIPIIMAGGSGTRLWPLSRTAYPKQFLDLHGEHTMLQTTALRLQGKPEIAEPVILCGETHRFLVAEQFREAKLKHGGILLEPEGRNTAPAVAVAAYFALEKNPDAQLLVLAADHVITDVSAFHKAIEHAAAAAKTGKLVTFGIVPDRPETGYGYIHRGQEYAIADSDASIYKVSQFVEKPNLETAEQYLATGNYYWNSGMFLFSAKRYLEELKRFRPDIHEACRLATALREQDLDFHRLDPDAFGKCPSDSIDYAVMEKTEEAVVVPLDAGWNDVGSWSALWDISPQDEAANVKRGDVLLEDVSHTYVHASDKLVAAVGVKDLVIVETADALLVAARDRVQDVKKVVDHLRSQNREEADTHRKVYRPWGWYDTVVVGQRHQVKHIHVKPKAKLSLQMHHHRAEHWVVVKGTAKVTIDGKTSLVSENQSAYIPLGKEHRLENPGVIDLQMIEVQSGSYLGEDDIVRFEDTYGRAENGNG